MPEIWDSQRTVRYLDPAEQARVDGLLLQARRYYYLMWLGAIFAGVLRVLDTAGSVILPWIGEVATLHAVTMLLIVVAGLGIVADWLLRWASPWLRYDPRRPLFAWLVLGSWSTHRSKSTAMLLFPVGLVAWAAAATEGTLGGGLVYFAASAVLVLGPRLSGGDVRHLEGLAGQPRRYTRLSTRLIVSLNLLRSWFLPPVFVCWILARVPDWAGQFYFLLIICSSVFVALLLLAAAVELLAVPIDEYGQRFGFVTVQKLAPASQFIGKPVVDALFALDVKYEDLQMDDSPPGKLRSVFFTKVVDRKPMNVHLLLKYSAKGLFAPNRDWAREAVAAAVIENVEYKQAGKDRQRPSSKTPLPPSAGKPK